eukprot:14252433-Alexandrium_andersonii.AAC.1
MPPGSAGGGACSGKEATAGHRLYGQAAGGRGRRYELPPDQARGLTGRSGGALIAIRPAGAGRADSPARSDVA